MRHIIIICLLALGTPACFSFPTPRENTKPLRTGEETAKIAETETLADLQKEKSLVRYGSSLDESKKAPGKTHTPAPNTTQPITPQTTPPTTPTDPAKTNTTPSQTDDAKKAKPKDDTKDVKLDSDASNAP